MYIGLLETPKCPTMYGALHSKYHLHRISLLGFIHKSQSTSKFRDGSYPSAHAPVSKTSG
jgi:hypothetical protein